MRRRGKVTATRSTVGNRFDGDGGGQVIHHLPVAGFGSRLRSAANNLEKGIMVVESSAYAELPPGWASGDVTKLATINCRDSAAGVVAALAASFWNSPDEFLLWLGARFCDRTHPFERNVINVNWKC